MTRGERMKNNKTIDQYIQGYPEEVKQLLEKMRQTIQKAAPEATEAIAYGIPTFRQNGNLVHFGGFKKHIGFYPAPSGIEEFKDEVKQYEAGKGSLQFPIDKPIPYDLITRIVKFRALENAKKTNQ